MGFPGGGKGGVGGCGSGPGNPWGVVVWGLWCCSLFGYSVFVLRCGYQRGAVVGAGVGGGGQSAGRGVVAGGGRRLASTRRAPAVVAAANPTSRKPSGAVSVDVGAWVQFGPKVRFNLERALAEEERE